SRRVSLLLPLTRDSITDGLRFCNLSMVAYVKSSDWSGVFARNVQKRSGSLIFLHQERFSRVTLGQNSITFSKQGEQSLLALKSTLLIHFPIRGFSYSFFQAESF